MNENISEEIQNLLSKKIVPVSNSIKAISTPFGKPITAPPPVIIKNPIPKEPDHHISNGVVKNGTEEAHQVPNNKINNINHESEIKEQEEQKVDKSAKLNKEIKVEEQENIVETKKDIVEEKKSNITCIKPEEKEGLVTDSSTKMPVEEKKEINAKLVEASDKKEIVQEVKNESPDMPNEEKKEVENIEKSTKEEIPEIPIKKEIVQEKEIPSIKNEERKEKFQSFIEERQISSHEFSATKSMYGFPRNPEKKLNDLQKSYRDVRHQIEDTNRLLYRSYNELNYYITKGHLLEEEKEKNKRLAESAEADFIDIQAKLKGEEDLNEARSREENEVLRKELASLLLNITTFHEERKKQEKQRKLLINDSKQKVFS